MQFENSKIKLGKFPTSPRRLNKSGYVNSDYCSQKPAEDNGGSQRDAISLTVNQLKNTIFFGFWPISALKITKMTSFEGHHDVPCKI